jgi:predicted Abi (CAAX) family protease
VVVVSGSLWPAVLLHGVAVVAWRGGLARGKGLMSGKKRQA